MASMLELIRTGKAPQSIRRRAARGELTIAAPEAVAILSLLVTDSDLCGDAEQALRRFDENSLREIACNTSTSPEVLRCLLQTQRHRPALIEALQRHPAMAAMNPPVAAMKPPVPAMNPAPAPVEVAPEPEQEFDLMRELAIEAKLDAEAASYYAAGNIQELILRYSDGLPVPAEDERPFELVPAADGEADPLADLLERADKGETVEEPEEQEQLSLIQRIGRMRVGERIKLALLGTREERMILIRDRSKLVSLAVLASPKVSDLEMEGFASMKNIQEMVLRAIAASRKNMKNYGVIRALASNPKAPLDVSLPLISHLLLKDLRALGISKNVNETLRKRANRLYRLKTERKKDS